MSLRRMLALAPSAGRLVSPCSLQTRAITLSLPFADKDLWRKKVELWFKTMNLAADQKLTIESFEWLFFHQKETGRWNQEDSQRVFNSLVKVAEAFGLKPGVSWSVEDYMAVMEETAKHKAGREAAMGLLQALFLAFDTNDDGYLDREEWGHYLEMMNLPTDPKSAALAFDSVDTNKDGRLSKEEFVNYCFEFWCTDENTLGTKDMHGALPQ